MVCPTRAPGSSLGTAGQDFREHHFLRGWVKKGKKGASAHAPALTLRALTMSLAQSWSTSESSQLDEIQYGLKELKV